MKAEDVAPDKAEITAAVAQAALEQDRQRRIRACSAEIQAALETHGCLLSGVFVWEAGQGHVQVRIVAR